MNRETLEIESILASFDSLRGSALEDARERLVGFGEAILPAAIHWYPRLRRAESRRAVVYTAMKFGRTSGAAVQLGIDALDDRSNKVRHFACMLLAWSRKRHALPALEARVRKGDPDGDATAAIEAIRERNSDLFVDRRRTGRIHLHILGTPPEA